MDKQSSAKLSSLASEVQKMCKMTGSVHPDTYNALLDKAKSLAGSVMSQDQTPGNEETDDSDSGLGSGRSEEHSRR